MRQPVTARLGAVLTLLALACGEEQTWPGSGPTELSIAVVAGDAQEGMVGAELPQPLRVRITRDGQPVAGAPVSWSTSYGSLVAHGPTDPDGVASAMWNLPREQSQTLSARAALPEQGSSGVVFHASANFPLLEVLDGSDQQGMVGTELPDPVRVRVTWRGAPVEGEAIHWSPNVRPLSELTDIDGIAAGAWRLRTVAGEVSATARLDGRNPPQVVFRAMAVCSPSDPCARLAPLGYVRQATVLVTDFDGSEPAALADGATRPAWSPDGSQIAFTRPTNDRLATWQLCVARADGSDDRCVVGDRDGTILGRPSWSPDGAKVAFAMFVHSCPNGNCGQLGGFFSSLRVLSIATMAVDTVDTPPLTSVSWSPDGRRIAFTAFGVGTFGRGALGVVDPDGSELEWLAASLGSYSVSEVAWSPDGRRLALALMDENACPWYCDTAIGVVEADASRLTVLATAQTGAGRYVFWPAWSPDGTRIAYTLSEGDDAGYDAVYPGSDILIINADGGRSEVLVSGGGLPTWRP